MPARSMGESGQNPILLINLGLNPTDCGGIRSGTNAFRDCECYQVAGWIGVDARHPNVPLSSLSKRTAASFEVKRSCKSMQVNLSSSAGSRQEIDVGYNASSGSW